MYWVTSVMGEEVSEPDVSVHTFPFVPVTVQEMALSAFQEIERRSSGGSVTG